MQVSLIIFQVGDFEGPQTVSQEDCVEVLGSSDPYLYLGVPTSNVSHCEPLIETLRTLIRDEKNGNNGIYLKEPF